MKVYISMIKHFDPDYSRVEIVGVYNSHKLALLNLICALYAQEKLSYDLYVYNFGKGWNYTGLSQKEVLHKMMATCSSEEKLVKLLGYCGKSYNTEWVFEIQESKIKTQS